VPTAAAQGRWSRGQGEEGKRRERRGKRKGGEGKGRGKEDRRGERNYKSLNFYLPDVIISEAHCLCLLS
jgi:hypothetical protein